MIFVGMDVHDKTTTFCLFDPALPAHRQHRLMTLPTNEETFRQVLEPLCGQCKVAFEVGVQSQWLARIVRPLAASVQVANSSRIPWLFRDGRKNDRMDAKKLATLLYLDQLPTVHLPAADVSAWRSLINYRRTLIGRRTEIKNQVRSILRTFVRKCPHESCWSRVGLQWLRSQTFDAARNAMLALLLDELGLINRQLQEVERQLDAIAETQPNVALLRTIPGIGPRTAEAIVAFADQVERFRDRKRFTSYFGMTPTQDASGGRDRHGHISKRGPSVVRWVLVEATHQTIWRCPVIRRYFERVCRGKKDRYRKAIVATGRKLLTIAYAMMRDQVPFNAARIAAA